MDALRRRDTVWPTTTRVAKASYDDSLPNSNEAGVLETQHAIVPETTLARRKDKPSLTIAVPDAVPRPPPFRFASTKPALKQNVHAVPTARNLEHSIVVTPKPVWDLYDPIAGCVNQGKAHSGEAILCRRRRMGTDISESLYVAKSRHWAEHDRLKHFAKPKSPCIVQMHAAFFSRDRLWTIYEEMDISLEQVFALDGDPWQIFPVRGNDYVAAISSQILQGLHYLQKTFSVQHGDLCLQNVLLNRTGAVKLANIVESIIPIADFQRGKDMEDLRKLLVKMLLPLEPREGLLKTKCEESAYDFYVCVQKTDMQAALQHPFISKIDLRLLSQLVNWTKQSVFTPPQPLPDDILQR